MTFPYGQTVTLIKRSVSGVDAFGNDTYSETSVAVSNCVVQPSGSTEDIQWTDEVSTNITVFMPYGTDIAATDSVEVGGIRYEVNGDPNSWVSPFSGRTAPMQVSLRKVTGASV